MIRGKRKFAEKCLDVVDVLSRHLSLTRNDRNNYTRSTFPREKCVINMRERERERERERGGGEGREASLGTFDDLIEFHFDST